MNKDKLIELSKQNGIEDIQIVTDDVESQNLQYFNGSLEKNETAHVKIITVSGLVNDKLAVYKIEDLNMAEEDIVKAIKENALALTSEEAYEIYKGSDSYPTVEFEQSDYHEISFDKKVELLSSLETKLKQKDSRVVQIPEIDYSQEKVEKNIVNSKGLNISKKNEYCLLAAEIVVADENAPQTGFKVEVKKNIRDFDIDEIVDEIVTKATSKLGAKPITSGDYPVIIENEAMADLLQAMCSMFLGEAHLKKVSPLVNRLNEKVFSELITIKDEPLKKDALEKEPFDDEGVACFDKVVVDKGVFKMMLHNLKTAKAFGCKSTGNGFANSISPKNFYIEPKEKSKQDLISSIKKGVMLCEFDGLHAGLNPISGDLSLKTSGYYIENGEIVKPITLIILTGNFIEMLNRVEEVGSDLKISYSGIGSPSIKFTSLSISGD